MTYNDSARIKYLRWLASHHMAAPKGSLRERFWLAVFIKALRWGPGQ